MRKSILLGLAIACAAVSQALAINRYNALSYTCPQAQALIQRERAVILRYPAERVRNMTLYDRFVSNSDSCDVGYYAYLSYIPTRGASVCPVYTCRPSTDFDDDIIIP
ncbi:hypothetical protein AB4Z52_08035 [Rhizobium sp. 2YAF20]|uniref:hypothetical protein n=1 Tax=Rhizobium sp. 2YAF20 TaxID=3233027 RepID=UPI003F94D678